MVVVEVSMVELSRLDESVAVMACDEILDGISDGAEVEIDRCRSSIDLKCRM